MLALLMAGGACGLKAPALPKSIGQLDGSRPEVPGVPGAGNGDEVTPHTIAAAAAGPRPAWCSALGDARLDARGSLEDVLADDDPRNALRDIVGRMCEPDADDRERMGDLEAARKKWSARLELTEADWSDVAAYAALDQSSRMSGEVKLQTRGEDEEQARKRAWSSFDALDQFYWLNTPTGASGDLTLDPNYLADGFGAKLTEAGRLAYVSRCIKGKNPVEWAMCQGDIDRLDLGKLAAEVRENQTYGGHEKMRVRILAAATRPLLEAHAAKIKKLIAADPAYGKLFELAAAARKEWDGRYKTDATLLALVAEMDDARAMRSTRAFAGCEDKTWSAMRAAIATVPAKQFEVAKGGFLDTATQALTHHPTAYLAAIAFATCMTAGPAGSAARDVLVRSLGDALEYWPGFRGPRTAAESAMLQAGISLDDRATKLDFPTYSRPFGGSNTSTSGGGEGVIAKLTPSGKTVTVEFKKQMVQQVQCAETRETRKITRIRSDGTLQYEVICVRNETVTVDKSDPPQKVSPRYLEGVKPGMYVEIIEDVVLGAWANPGAAAPKIVFGVTLT